MLRHLNRLHHIYCQYQDILYMHCDRKRNVEKINRSKNSNCKSITVTHMQLFLCKGGNHYQGLCILHQQRLCISTDTVQISIFCTLSESL